VRKFIKGPLCGIISLGLITLNTLFCTLGLFIVTVFKMAIPVNGFRLFCSRILDGMATRWVGVNVAIQKMTMATRWDIKGIESFNPRSWYLVISNHQNWVDIFVLQRIFHKKLPFLKFFIKKELMWFPIMGQAWWALDFPFMKRYSKQFLEKHPHLRGKDVEITRKACEKFKKIPVSVMNFVEGTRFTPQKHERQQSPYKNLLKPKAGGISYVLMTMGEQLNKIMDVTIIYPDGPTGFWSFLCGKVRTIKVMVNTIPVPEELMGDPLADADLKAGIQNWLNSLWLEKDKSLSAG
jgi:1-acyl-sn-glycerol-3-phosphate acyltransferase